ncbi:chemosensory protein 8 [Leptinotarsa decemlineata]|uniref:chemosensory protein 8 n=1 Tax=Leptinotarsa decemlineata TaxID=7539 RepID=UPI000C255732|nr:uncharacterized protein LOC111502326 [Leptinotarsa decemlineata]
MHSQKLIKKWTSLVLFVLLMATITKSQRLPGNDYMQKQLLCALDRAPCDALGSQIKDALPEIIGNNCHSCDHRQAANARKIAIFIQSKYPDVWIALLNKYSTIKT